MTDQPFTTLIEQRAPLIDILAWFDRQSAEPGISGAEWLTFVPPVLNAASGLEWLVEADRESVRADILRFAVHALTTLFPRSELADKSVSESLKDFNTWIYSRDDDTVVELCWEMLADKRDFTPSLV